MVTLFVYAEIEFGKTDGKTEYLTVVYITPEIQRMVDAQLDKWFPEYTDYEII